MRRAASQAICWRSLEGCIEMAPVLCPCDSARRACEDLFGTFILDNRRSAGQLRQCRHLAPRDDRLSRSERPTLARDAAGLGLESSVVRLVLTLICGTSRCNQYRFVPLP